MKLTPKMQRVQARVTANRAKARADRAAIVERGREAGRMYRDDKLGAIKHYIAHVLRVREVAQQNVLHWRFREGFLEECPSALCFDWVYKQHFKHKPVIRRKTHSNAHCKRNHDPKVGRTKDGKACAQCQRENAANWYHKEKGNTSDPYHKRYAGPALGAHEATTLPDDTDPVIDSNVL